MRVGEPLIVAEYGQGQGPWEAPKEFLNLGEVSVAFMRLGIVVTFWRHPFGLAAESPDEER